MAYGFCQGFKEVGETNKEGSMVHITWKDQQHDWEWFFLLGSVGELIHLKGADKPDGSVKHQGDSFWIHYSEIESMVDV